MSRKKNGSTCEDASSEDPRYVGERSKLYSGQCKAWRNAAILEEEVVHVRPLKEILQFFEHAEEEHITGVPTKPKGIPHPYDEPWEGIPLPGRVSAKGPR